jgi:hypothetical protein
MNEEPKLEVQAEQVQVEETNLELEQGQAQVHHTTILDFYFFNLISLC